MLHAGAQNEIVIEVLAQSDARHVRGIALMSTQGLARGMVVTDTGGPLKAPVGKAILSRMFDVFGNAIDRQPSPADVQWRSVHRAPPPLARRSTKSEIFETGIKVIDVLVPLERGGKRSRMASVFKLYMDGGNIAAVMAGAKVSKGSVSGYLNEIESAIGCRIVRGSKQPNPQKARSQRIPIKILWVMFQLSDENHPPLYLIPLWQMRC